MLAAEAGAASAAFPILTALVLVPIVGAALVALSPKSRPETSKLIAMISAVATAAMSIWLMASVESGEAGFLFVSTHTVIEPSGISSLLLVDVNALFLVVLTGILSPIVIAGIVPLHD